LYAYDLVLGLPHTNHAGLAEHLLLMSAGHFQWTSIARAIGRPLSALRTLAGGEVYATFYFIEERFPETTPIGGFGLDDHLTFGVFLRAFKNIAVEGQVLFDHAPRIAATLAAAPGLPGPDAVARHPYIRFANIFITPEAGNSRLRVAPPANADFSGLAPLPNDENPYHLTRSAEATGRLEVLDDTWQPADRRPGFEHRYAIDPDRDTNGAGLVYFANYVAFMDAAERAALAGNCRQPFTAAGVTRRTVEHRRIAYYGNVDVADSVRTEVALFLRGDDATRVGVRYTIRRNEDGRLICLSEAVKRLAGTSAR
jgi:probable biosynthetic protein (TIGR04098 family)